jgi:hypothetical protein
MESSKHVRMSLPYTIGVLTMERKVVQFRHVSRGSVGMTRIWETSCRIPQLIEERMDHGVNCRQPLGRGVLQQLGDEIDRIGICLPEHLEFCKLDSVSSSGPL